MTQSESCPNLVMKTTGRWQEFICTRNPKIPCSRKFCDGKKQVVMTDAEES